MKGHEEDNWIALKTGGVWFIKVIRILSDEN